MHIFQFGGIRDTLDNLMKETRAQSRPEREHEEIFVAKINLGEMHFLVNFNSCSCPYLIVET